MWEVGEDDTKGRARLLPTLDGQLVQHVAIGSMGMSQGAKRDITHPCILWGS